MRKAQGFVVGAVALAMVGGGCFGSFNLTRKLYHWNEQSSQDKWVREAIFIVLVWAPVYGLAGLGDAVVFNSIEFWTGENPIKMNRAASDTKRIVRKDAEVILSRMHSVEGDQLLIQQFRSGAPAGSLRIQPHGAQTVASTADGQALFFAQTLPDGSILVSDAHHQQVGLYSPSQIETLVASARQK